MLEGTGTGLWEWDIGADNVRWSPNIGPMFGLAYGESPPTYADYLELEHPEDRDVLGEAIRGAIERGEDYEREFRAVWQDGTVRWLHSRAHVITDDDGRPYQIAGLISDVTDRKQRTIATEYLARASAVLAESLDIEETLQRIAQLAVPELADWCSVTLRRPEGGLDQIAVAHEDPERLEFADEYTRRYPPDPDATTGVANVIRSGRPELYPVIPPGVLEAAARDAEHLQLIRELNLRSVMMVPLTARGETLGAISFVSAESGREYGTAELELAEELGRRAGQAIANVRLFEEARQTAVILQRALLPDLPDLPTLDAAARYLPGMEGTEVGGDWYDVIALSSGRTAIVVGDVLGRGVPAAALMGQLRTAVRSYALVADGPAETMNLVAAYATARGDIDFATVLLLTLEADGRTAVASSAGHLMPVLAPREGRAQLVEIDQGPPLGLPGHEYVETTLEIPERAMVLLYTDGLVERRRVPLDDGLARLLRCAEAGPRDPDGMLDHVLAQMLPEGSDDDVAVLAACART